MIRLTVLDGEITRFFVTFSFSYSLAILGAIQSSLQTRARKSRRVKVDKRSAENTS